MPKLKTEQSATIYGPDVMVSELDNVPIQLKNIATPARRDDSRTTGYMSAIGIGGQSIVFRQVAAPLHGTAQPQQQVRQQQQLLWEGADDRN